MRIKGTNKAIAVTNDGNGRFCYLDPYVGGAIAVAEACRNLSAVGAEPIAITDCLNFGNPERPDVYFQLEQCVKGIAAACKVFGVPVVSGNVSLYNETRGTAIWPTPVIGALGILENASDRTNIKFHNEGDIVIMLGDSNVSSDVTGLSGSAYLEVMFGKVQGVPFIDLDMEYKVQKLCRDAIKEGLINSSHDVSDGGLAVALAESCVQGNIGFRSNWQLDQDWQAALFGEAQSRIIISMSKDKLSKFEALAEQESTPWVLLGVVGGTSLRIGTLMDVSLEDLDKAWSHSLQESLS